MRRGSVRRPRRRVSCERDRYGFRFGGCGAWLLGLCMIYMERGFHYNEQVRDYELCFVFGVTNGTSFYVYRLSSVSCNNCAARYDVQSTRAWRVEDNMRNRARPASETVYIGRLHH